MNEYHLDGIHCASVECCEVGCRVSSLSHTESHSQLPLTLMQCSVLYHNLTINNFHSIMMMAQSESTYLGHCSNPLVVQNINKLITIVITSRQTIARVMNDSPEPETRMITVISDVGAGVRETERPEPEHGSGKSDGLSLSLSLFSASRLSRRNRSLGRETPEQMHGGGARP